MLRSIVLSIVAITLQGEVQGSQCIGIEILPKVSYTSPYHNYGVVQLSILEKGGIVDADADWQVSAHVRSFATTRAKRKHWNALFECDMHPGHDHTTMLLDERGQMKHRKSSVPLILIDYHMNTANNDDLREGIRIVQADCGRGWTSSHVELGFGTLWYKCRRDATQCTDYATLKQNFVAAQEVARRHISAPTPGLQQVEDEKRRQIALDKTRRKQLIQEQILERQSIIQDMLLSEDRRLRK